MDWQPFCIGSPAMHYTHTHARKQNGRLLCVVRVNAGLLLIA